MNRISAFLVFSLWLTASSAAAGDFPPNLAFLDNLPVAISGECLADADGRDTARFIPCEARVAPDADGWHRYYIIETAVKPWGADMFTISPRRVEPPAEALPEDMTVVMRGMCRGQEFGLTVFIRCEIVVFPDHRIGERIYLRLFNSGVVGGEFFTVYREIPILADRHTN